MTEPRRPNPPRKQAARKPAKASSPPAAPSRPAETAEASRGRRNRKEKGKAPRAVRVIPHTPREPKPLHPNPVTAAAMEVLGLWKLPTNRKRLDFWVAERQLKQDTPWSWDQTAAWRYLREQLPPPKTHATEAR